ncbi:MAG: hypothetical protein AVDCRST_MAG02-1136 [uncultured Rubrobacteraceae bacterium]|uniref:Uncharacterized protein n=1 Tax=uncultured Rubrobacteraceae bacterium TaxID=349277 RepID=A0A6J4QQ94_9ACTN|nr:MAG: hypothetical protein AVDCRST_MAG02-1136 [uncultured Rubrobacteraceae bacterium]
MVLSHTRTSARPFASHDTIVFITGGRSRGPKSPLPGSRGASKTEREARTYDEATLLVPTRCGRLGGDLVGRRGDPMGVLRRRKDERDLLPTDRELPRMRQGFRTQGHAVPVCPGGLAPGDPIRRGRPATGRSTFAGVPSFPCVRPAAKPLSVHSVTSRPGWPSSSRIFSVRDRYRREMEWSANFVAEATSSSRSPVRKPAALRASFALTGTMDETLG